MICRLVQLIKEIKEDYCIIQKIKDIQKMHNLIENHSCMYCLKKFTKFKQI